MLFFNRRKRYFFEYENDIHAHVLPGLDDGVKTMDEAVMIVKRMEQVGLRRLTCTPHVAYPAMINTPKDVESMLFVLKSRLPGRGGACRGGFRGGIPDGGVYAGVVGKGRNHGIEPGRSVG